MTWLFWGPHTRHLWLGQVEPRISFLCFFLAENKGGKSGARQHFCHGLEPSGCGPQPDRQGINRDYRRVLSPTVPVFNDRTLLTKEETFACFLHFAPRFPLWHAYFVGLRIKCELVMEAEPARPWLMGPSNCLTSRVELA